MTVSAETVLAGDRLSTTSIISCAIFPSIPLLYTLFYRVQGIRSLS